MRADKRRLLDYLIRDKILKTKSVIKAFETVKREEFIPKGLDKYAYVDEPLPLFEGQTISQPYTVAVMTEALEPRAGNKIVEVGAGSGYQAALLSKIVKKVITIERLESLYEFAKENLKNYKNVKVILGDGSKGYKKEAPFDRIIITAAAPSIPEPLFEQLREKGIMIIPVGSKELSQSNKKWADSWNKQFGGTGYGVGEQRLLKVRKIKGKIKIEYLGPFVFVPLVGEFGFLPTK